MPYLPDGTYIDDDEYAAQQLGLLASQIPLSGTVAGTNYNVAPYIGGANVNLGWDQAPNFGAMINFDPSAGLENAFISDYDISGSGMANVGDVSSPNAALSLTAGLEGTGLSTPDPYLQAAVTDVVPGLGVSTGTNIPSQATFSAGNLEDQGYSLGLSKFSHGPTQAAFSMGLTPGVTANISTDPSKTNPSGLKFESSWDDAGKMLRQFLGGAKNLLSPISKAGADASVPEIAVAPSMSGVDYSQALADVGIEPTTAGMAEVYNPGMTYTALESPFGGSLSGGISRVPEDSMATEEFDSDEEVLTPAGWMDLNVDPIGDPTYDPIQHLDTIYGTVTQPSISPVTGEYLLHRDLTKIAPQVLRDIALNIKDTAKKADEQASGKSIEKVQEDIQDVVNNMIGWDARKAGIDIRDAVKSGVHPTVVTDPKQFTAMAKLMQSGDASLEDSAMELASQVDTFKELSTQPVDHVARKSDAWNLDKPSVTHVPTQPAVPAYTGPTRAELKAAAAAQRKADLAAQKAAARRTALARQALKDSQAAAARAAAASAAQAKSEQAKAKAVLAAAAGRDKGGPSQAEIDAAIEVMTQVDTFGGGRIRGDGPMSAAEINVAGGMEFGGAGGMAGSGRGGGGRGGPGGRGR